MESPFIFDEDETYKMSLWIETNPNFDDTFLNIYLLVWHDEDSDDLIWPFTRNVYIELSCQSTSISQYQPIVIEKPMTNSNAFSFEYSTFNIANYIQIKCLF